MRIFQSTLNPASIFSFSLFVHLVSATSSSGCGSDLPKHVKAGGDSVNFTIESGGLARTYLLYVPENYQTNVAAPLIFSFHGGGQTAADQEALCELSTTYMNPDAVVLYPEGVNQAWQGDPDQPSSINDITFTTDLISNISSSYCIDSTRIFATGKSDGGGFVGELACNYNTSTLFAAFAPVAGAFYNQDPSQCNTGRDNIPIIEFHGLDDTTIPYFGGDRRGSVLPSIPSWLQSWALRDAIEAANITTAAFKDNVIASAWIGGGKNMTLGYLIDNLGHAWPSTEPNADNSAGTYLNATTIIMQFFSNHALQETSSTASATLSAGATPTATGTSTAAATTTKASLGSMSSPVEPSKICFIVGIAILLSTII